MHWMFIHLEKGYSLETGYSGNNPNVTHTQEPTAIDKVSHELYSEEYFSAVLKDEKGAQIAIIHSVKCTF